MATNQPTVKTVSYHGEELSLMEISRLEGVGDLPMSVRGKLAKALYLEAEAGHTTDEAWAVLEEGVRNEAAA